MATAAAPGGTYGKIVVTVKSAHNLMDKAWIGKSDPYCAVKIADAEIQTHHVKNAGEHCAWEESFAFNNVSPDDVVEFHVYDKNRLIKDAHMGEGSMSLREVFERGAVDTRVPLNTRAGTKAAGEVWVSMRRADEGREAGAGAGAAAPAGVRHEEHRAAAGAGMAGGAGMHREGARYEEARAEGVHREGAHAETTRREGEAVCGQEFFTRTEDRPIVKERITRVVEHHPVEREYVVETRATGVEKMHVGTQETVGEEERIVSVAQPTPPCEDPAIVGHHGHGTHAAGAHVATTGATTGGAHTTGAAGEQRY